jgi:hypothetical protein
MMFSGSADPLPSLHNCFELLANEPRRVLDIHNDADRPRDRQLVELLRRWDNVSATVHEDQPRAGATFQPFHHQRRDGFGCIRRQRTGEARVNEAGERIDTHRLRDIRVLATPGRQVREAGLPPIRDIVRPQTEGMRQLRVGEAVF